MLQQQHRRRAVPAKSQVDQTPGNGLLQLQEDQRAAVLPGVDVAVHDLPGHPVDGRVGVLSATGEAVAVRDANHPDSESGFAGQLEMVDHVSCVVCVGEL